MGLTCIQTPRLEDVLGGDVPEEGLTPIYLYLRDYDKHAYQNAKDLGRGIVTISRWDYS